MLTNLQIEILKTFSRPMPESQVLEIRELLSNYFLNKMDDELDRLTKENNWTEQTFIDWSKEHNRTPYIPKNHEGSN